jgi:hypothetical protein
MEPTIGIEPMNLFLTKEALCRLSYVGIFITAAFCFSCFKKKLILKISGAGDEIRTRDIQLGRLELYQLSYSRLIDYGHNSRHRDTSEVKKIRSPWSCYSVPAKADSLEFRSISP